MTTVPTELSANSVISLIDAGRYPREVVHTIARGFLPLEQDDLIAILAYLMTSDDAEAAELARVSMSEVPQKSIVSFAANEQAAPEHLARLVHATLDPVVLEPLIRNRAVPDETIAELALRATPAVQEIIVINQARIIRAPQILDALLANPNLAPEARRRALETREEFFDKKARAVPSPAEDLEEEDLRDVPLDAIADLLEKAEVEPEAEAAVTMPELSETEKKDAIKQSVWQRLLTMGISDKVKMAFKGDRTVRMILVRERNKLICSATMRNPRMTDTEVESIAGMRNVDDEVLRLISMRRDWMAKYSIVLALIRNPKAPIGVVLPLINRLTLRDLKSLKDDKGVTEVVRQTARKFYQAKQKS
ncbi:MAG TPA: hypothetical protein VGF69_07430 [Thermoanaerobaculia bacterium]|jgi:hypothetical protein